MDPNGLGFEILLELRQEKSIEKLKTWPIEMQVWKVNCTFNGDVDLILGESGVKEPHFKIRNSNQVVLWLILVLIVQIRHCITIVS